MKKKWILVLLCLLFLCGCGKEPPEPQITESLLWEQAPALIHGSLEYEKLAVEPWHCGRLEYTSGNKWAETELGYYYYESLSETLFYADKANLSNWVPVCGKPHCPHTRNILGCDARLAWRSFYIRDGRIRYGTLSGGKNEPTYVPDMENIPIMCSRALNGTDLQIDYIVEGANANMFSSVFTPEHWLMNTAVFNSDGTYTHQFWRVTEDGSELLAEMRTQEEEAYPRNYAVVDMGIFLQSGYVARAFTGDRQFYNELLDEIAGVEGRLTMFRYRNGAVEQVEIAGYEQTGRYLSGDTLRLYRENDGYYDLDLITREETFVAKPVMADSYATVFLPNCITEKGEAGWKLFDGTAWREIRIPEEYQDVSLSIQGIASDRIFLSYGIYSGEVADVYLYQIRLDQEELVLEYCGQIC